MMDGSIEAIGRAKKVFMIIFNLTVSNLISITLYILLKNVGFKKMIDGASYFESSFG